MPQPRRVDKQRFFRRDHSKRLQIACLPSIIRPVRMKNELDATRSAQPDRVAVVQTALGDSLAVCKSTRSAAEIAQQIMRAVGEDLRVITRNVRIVEHE